jgi:threonine/homoserine/homoserine lactone efflux protein
MLSSTELALFTLTALVLVLTPGPNMIYCVSRTLSQGRRAGLVSLAGVLVGFVAHLLAATLGLTALLHAVPLAFDALRLAGAAYLLWLAIDAIRPGGTTPFQTRSLPVDAPGRLFRMGLLTNLLNPKVAMFYSPSSRSSCTRSAATCWLQSLQLGRRSRSWSARRQRLADPGARRASPPSWRAAAAGCGRSVT